MTAAVVSPATRDRSGTVRHRLRASVVLLLGLCALTLGWSLLLRHNLARTEELMRVVTDQKARNLTLLSADVLEYRDYFARFPRTRGEWSDQNVYVEYYKRAAYGPVSAAINTVVHRALGIPFPASMYLILSFYAALASTLLFVLMRMLGLAMLESLLLAGIATASFSWLSLFSVPESYSLSVCATILAAISGTRLPQLDAPRARVAILRHVLVVGILSWIYLPVCGAILLVAARVTHPRQWITRVVPAAAGAFLVALAPQMAVGLDALRFQLDYAQRVSSPTHFDDPGALGQVAATFILFGLVTPVPDFIHAKATADIAAALATWPALLASGLLVGLYVALIVRTISFSRLRALSGALLWFAILYLFHVLYNPSEVLLYASIPTTVLVYIAGLALAPSDRPYPTGSPIARRLMVGGLLLVLITLLAVNASAVL